MFDHRNIELNGHLKLIHFEAGSIVFKGDEGVLNGQLTIRDITKPISLNVDFGGFNRDSLGKLRAGFSFKGKINRKDFGLNWNTILNDGGIMVGNDVKISGEIQLVKQ